ncbi:MAG: hypothetical protein ACQETW_04285 [Pseudomonadota bacterium]
MRRNLIHIGYHKTATNWFQHVLYPRVENGEYLHRKRVRAAFLRNSGLMFDEQAAVSALGAKGNTPFILCEEELSGNIHTGGLFGCFTREIARRLNRALPDSDVVIFVRNQVDMIASVYRQYVKEGGTYPVNRYLHHQRYLTESGFQPAKAPLFSFDHFDYAALVEFYDELFGQERVHVYPYEAFKKDNHAFMESYLYRFGMDVDLEALPDIRPNPPYGRGVLPLARFLNHFSRRDVLYKRYWLHVPGFYKLRGSTLKRLSKLPVLGGQISSETLLGTKNVAFIRERYAESNRRLAHRIDYPLSDYGYTL